MRNQNAFEEYSQSLLHRTALAEEAISQLGQRLDSKDMLLSQLEVTDVSDDIIEDGNFSNLICIILVHCCILWSKHFEKH